MYEWLALLAYYFLNQSSSDDFQKEQESKYEAEQNDPSLDIEAKIQAAVYRYFTLQYESLKRLKPVNFSFLVRPDLEHLKRLAYELKRGRRLGLGYRDYQFTADFKELEVKGHLARVSLAVDHYVVYQSFPDRISRMKGQSHNLELVKINGNWQISAHTIDDLVTAACHKAGLSLDEYLHQAQNWEITDLGLREPSPVPSILARGYYNRNAAVAYAHRWALSYNPAYADFTQSGGDCTNFASQVLHAGGLPMDQTGSQRWYYYALSRRSPSWSGVDELYTYLTTNTAGGGAARLVPLAQVQPGDIIQLEFDPSTWDFNHSPVVVHVGEAGNPAKILMAAHTINRDNYPLANYSYRALRPLSVIGAL